jgi:hypothetical protein
LSPTLLTPHSPPPNPPISVIKIFSDTSGKLVQIADSAAKRIGFHFGYYHLDVYDHIISIARTLELDGGIGAYNQGQLGWLHPEVFGRLVNEDRFLLKIPARHLVEIVKWKIDQLVAQGQRFVVPSSISAYKFDC